MIQQRHVVFLALDFCELKDCHLHSNNHGKLTCDSSVSFCLWAAQSVLISWLTQILFSLPAHLFALGPTQAQVQWILQVKWSLMLTTHFHLVLQLRMCGGLPLCRLYTFKACCLDTDSASLLLVFLILLNVLFWIWGSRSSDWSVTPCSLAKVHQCFWGKYCFHIKGQRKPRPSKNPARSRWQTEQLTFLLPTCWCSTWVTP
jgi:hypothetical protein